MDVEIPTYNDLMWPTLVALEQLGGSGTKDEIDEAVIELRAFTDQQLDVNFPPDATQTGSKIIHRLAWARTYLKKTGSASNSSRGVWAITPHGRNLLEQGEENGDAALREADREVRRQARQDKLAAAETGLDDTDNPDTPPDEDHDEWKLVLLRRLIDLQPDEFERLCGRLLRESGFAKVEVLGRSGDEGLDGTGILEVELISFPVFWQCKKYSGTVGPSHIRDFRGAMVGRGDKGLFITTSSFTSGAREEATRDGAPPIDLIDGDRLCDLLKTANLGISVELVEHVSVDPSFFEDL